MQIDIMDYFEFPQAAKSMWGEYDFEISFPKLERGMFGGKIKNGEELIEYAEDYYHFDMVSTVKAVADLLPEPENYDPCFHCLRHRTRFNHGLEIENYVFDLRTTIKKGDTTMWLQILVVEDLVDYDGIWFCENYFEDFCYDIGGLEVLKNRKIFAVELPFRYFLNVFYKACFDFLIQKKSGGEYKEKAAFLKQLIRIKGHLKTFL
jgi:hypothetical protein